MPTDPDAPGIRFILFSMIFAAVMIAIILWGFGDADLTIRTSR